MLADRHYIIWLTLLFLFSANKVCVIRQLYRDQQHSDPLHWYPPWNLWETKTLQTESNQDSLLIKHCADTILPLIRIGLPPYMVYKFCVWSSVYWVSRFTVWILYYLTCLCIIAILLSSTDCLRRASQCKADISNHHLQLFYISQNETDTGPVIQYQCLCS